MKHYVMDISEDGFVRVMESTREEIYAGRGKDYAYYRSAGGLLSQVVYGGANRSEFYKSFESWLRKLTGEALCTTQK